MVEELRIPSILKVVLSWNESRTPSIVLLKIKLRHIESFKSLFEKH